VILIIATLKKKGVASFKEATPESVSIQVCQRASIQAQEPDSSGSAPNFVWPTPEASVSVFWKV
jgi:hypothetical protein